MVKAGAIVFAPNDGGQTEVLDNPDLLFSDEDDAADKICSVLSSPQKQCALLAHLALRSKMFSAERFMEEVQAHVNRTPFNVRPTRMLQNRPKIVIGHPMVGYGGSESTLMWLIEALKRDFEITIVTTGGWDLPALNGFYGTHIGKDEVTVRIAPVPFLARSLSVAALRGSCYQRFARKVAAEYDIRISAYNTTDWGLPAVHLIADFSWLREIRERLDPPSLGFIYRKSPLRNAYLRIAAAYGKPSGRDVLRDDLVIANSRWSARIVKQYRGVDCAAVLYPSVWTEFPNVPWEEKELAFAMIGRIAPEKQIERAIEMLGAVRQRGHAIRLHLCGQIDNDLYGQSIAKLCRERADWIVTEGRVSGARKTQILANCRFGIHTRSAEPFGVSVAEMVKAGAIVFAPNDGGQAEILEHSDLLFSDFDDGVEKILNVLESPSLQSALRFHLAHQVQQFSAQSFIKDSQALFASMRTADQTSSGRVVNRTS
jgi:glycosyltransferase involved in cell wall biosynthesis